MFVGNEIGIGVTVGEGTVVTGSEDVEKEVAVSSAEGVGVLMIGDR